VYDQVAVLVYVLVIPLILGHEGVYAIYRLRGVGISHRGVAEGGYSHTPRLEMALDTHKPPMYTAHSAQVATPPSPYTHP